MEEIQDRIPLIVSGLLENLYERSSYRYVTLVVDVASVRYDTYIMTMTFDVRISKDFDLGWCIYLDDAVESIKSKYPHTYSRKDTYIDWKTMRIMKPLKK